MSSALSYIKPLSSLIHFSSEEALPDLFPFKLDCPIKDIASS